MYLLIINRVIKAKKLLCKLRIEIYNTQKQKQKQLYRCVKMSLLKKCQYYKLHYS